MRKLAALLTVVLATVPVIGAPPTTPPLPPSAILFNDHYSFTNSTPNHSAMISVGTDGAWLKSTSSNSGGWMNCSDRYRVSLAPNFSPYATLLGLGPTSVDACIGDRCFSCSPQWGGESKSYTYHTTDTDPGIVFAGAGQVTLSALTTDAEGLYLRLEQYNRADMTGMTIFQSREEDDPVPLQPSDPERYFIATGADKVPVVAEMLWGSTDRFPAGPNVTYTAAWDTGSIVNCEVTPSPLMPYGYSIVGVPVPKMSTGKHKFTVTAQLPSGKKYTSTNSIEVMVYAQNIYIGVEGTFQPKNPVDQLPQFIPGAALNGTNLDLRSTPQVVQLNILIGRGSSGTFDVKLTNVSRYPGIAMNHPLGATDSNPDVDFGSGLTELTGVSIPKGGAPKVVPIPLYIYDYGASAMIEVTMPYRKTTFTARRRVPLDADNNQLPDRGWTAVSSVEVSSTGLTAIGDIDAADGATGTDAAVTGDGFSNYEEYRGFFVAGGYVRLNPRQKEVFVDLDPEFLLAGPVASPLSALLTLSPRLLYVEPTEVDGDDLLSRNVLRTSPVVNGNRATVPVAHARPQRAVRLISQTVFPPAVHLAGPGIDVPIWQVGILGITVSDDVLDIDLLNAPGNVATLETPMRTQFSEVYTRTFMNLAVNTTFSYPEHYDTAGNVVPRCDFQGQANCDFWDTANNLIIPSQQPGGWGILYTVPDPAHDPVEHYSLQGRNCGADTPLLGGFTTIQMERLKGLIAAHEIGHALHMPHIGNFATDCGDIMFDDEAPAPHRRTMSTYTPQPTGFGPRNHQTMRLWQP